MTIIEALHQGMRCAKLLPMCVTSMTMQLLLIASASKWLCKPQLVQSCFCQSLRLSFLVVVSKECMVSFLAGQPLQRIGMHACNNQIRNPLWTFLRNPAHASIIEVSQEEQDGLSELTNAGRHLKLCSAIEHCNVANANCQHIRFGSIKFQNQQCE